MTNDEHEELTNAGRGHLSRYTVRPDADDVVQEFKELTRRRLESSQHERAPRRATER